MLVRPPAGDGDVLGAVTRRHAATVEIVVETGDGFAQLPDPGHRRVLLVGNVDLDVRDSGWTALERPRLGHALPQVAPVGILLRVAESLGFGHHVDHAGTRDGTNGVEHERRTIVSGDPSVKHPEPARRGCSASNVELGRALGLPPDLREARAGAAEQEPHAEQAGRDPHRRPGRQHQHGQRPGDLPEGDRGRVE